MNSTLSAPFCASRPSAENATLQWAEASWYGERVELRARSSNPSTAIDVVVCVSSGAEKRVSLVSGLAALPWQEPDVTPLTAQFIQGAEMLEVNVIDLRPPKEFSRTPLPEVDPSVAAALRDAFLLQRYGGAVADVESIPGLGGVQNPAGASAPIADYAVQAWHDARAAFAIIDQWQAALIKAKTDPALLERVRLDGRDLCALYQRRNGPAAELVAEELSWRIEVEV